MNNQTIKKKGDTQSFPVELQKDKLRVFDEVSKGKMDAKEVLKGVFPCADLTDTMSMTLFPKKFLWRPNNYRLKIVSNLGSIGNLGSIKGSMGILHMEFNSKGSKFLKINERVSLMVHPSCVIGVYSLKNPKGEKEWFEVSCDSVESFQNFIDKKVKEIEMLLRAEISKLGLPLDYSSGIWIRHEDGVKNEEFLDSLPDDLILHDTYFKKVYGNELEFKAPAYVKNFITNRAIESIVPELARELADIKSRLPSPERKEVACSTPSSLVQSPSKSVFSDLLCKICGWNQVYCYCVNPIYKSAILKEGDLL